MRKDFSVFTRNFCGTYFKNSKLSVMKLIDNQSNIKDSNNGWTKFYTYFLVIFFTASLLVQLNTCNFIDVTILNLDHCFQKMRKDSIFV